jgi:hypothetical protein
MAEVHLDGLRELKKQRTGAALNEAAADLCLRQGFDNTTVAQIAAIAEVSPRTFSRYFLQEGCRDRRDRRTDGRAAIARRMGSGSRPSDCADDHRHLDCAVRHAVRRSGTPGGEPIEARIVCQRMCASFELFRGSWMPGTAPCADANPTQARQLDSDYFH